MKKIILSAVLLFPAFVISCGGSDSSDKQMSEESSKICSDVSEIVRNVSSDVTTSSGFNSMSPSQKIAKKAAVDMLNQQQLLKASASTSGKGTWTDVSPYAGVKVSGTYEYASGTYSYTMTINFTNYTATEDGVQYVINGTETLSSTMTASADVWNVSLTFKEDITVAVGGATHTVGSDYVMTIVTNIKTEEGSWTTKGTFVFDGESYDVDESGND